MISSRLYSQRTTRNSSNGFKTFHGKKSSSLVAIGPSIFRYRDSLWRSHRSSAREKQITKVDVLAFEFEMGLFPNIQEEAKQRVSTLPSNIFPAMFSKAGYREEPGGLSRCRLHRSEARRKEERPVAIELTDFSVFYNQDCSKRWKRT